MLILGLKGLRAPVPLLQNRKISNILILDYNFIDNLDSINFYFSIFIFFVVYSIIKGVILFSDLILYVII